MGDNYSVVMRIKVARRGKSYLAGLVRKWMKRVEEGTDATAGVQWQWSYNRSFGARPDSLNGIVKILLGAHQGTFKHSVDNGGFDVYMSVFKATYTWGAVIRDAFREMAWALDDHSYLYIDRDDGADRLEVHRDRVWQEEARNMRELPYASEPERNNQKQARRRNRHG